MNLDTLKYLVVPDVHGRSFWKEPVKNVLENADKKIIFLGDYLDPYEYEEIYPNDAFKVFKEIVELKKSHPDRIVLLLGNHDLENLDPKAHKCRFDYVNATRNGVFYEENKDLFDFVYLDEIDGKRFVFCHAGFNPGWFVRNADNIPYFNNLPEDCSEDEIWKAAENSDIITETDWKDLYFNGTRAQKHMFNDVSYWRGGGDDFSSPVWADIKESINILEREPLDIVQIVGHSQQESDPVRFDDKLYCLDVRRCFVFTENGNITELDGSELKNNGKQILDEYFEHIKKYSGFFF